MNTLNELSARFFGLIEADGGRLSDKTANEFFCFRKELEKFLSSGKKEDAFTVYFCYSEIFRPFGKGYDNTQKLLETLSDHEYHSGELLTKHRDHYSHSVYVFSLGLAIYANDGAFRKTFSDFYGTDGGKKGAVEFLRLWGLVALFHDVGYPFQLAHEQIKSYAGELWKSIDEKLRPFVTFGNMDELVSLSPEVSENISKSLNTRKSFGNINELLAYGLNLRDGYDENGVSGILLKRVTDRPKFMDHGYFSAVILAKQLFLSQNFKFGAEVLDALTAILLHNSLNKFKEIAGQHPITVSEHPLAYLLILCDELQNWDRQAYGKVSKRDPIAWDVALNIRDNELQAEYIFDSPTIVDEKGDVRINRSFAEIQQGDFVAKIQMYVKSGLKLAASVKQKTKNKKTSIYASDNNFINLCDFAKAIHASYLDFCKDLDSEYLNASFDKLPLEYKVSNIEQAKSYAHKLELINCFYSSKDLDYPVITDFKTADFGRPGTDNLSFLCRLEHVRWVREKLDFGWKYGTDYTNAEERNKKKIHKDIVPYDLLSEEEQRKDEIMINNIIPLLKKFGNNIRIYKYRDGRKPDLEIGGMGHRFYKDKKEVIKELVKKQLLKYSEKYNVTVRTCYAYGADQLIAECANELGLTTKATLPTDLESYIKIIRKDCEENGYRFSEEDELNMRHLIAQTVVCKTVRDPEHFYLAASMHIIEKCNVLIAIWDGKQIPLEDENKNPINRGGTYHNLMTAKKRLKPNDIIEIECNRF